MVGIVVVSHSRALARAAVALAEEMVHGKAVRIAVAAGLDERTFGTDAVEIMSAIERGGRRGRRRRRSWTSAARCSPPSSRSTCSTTTRGPGSSCARPRSSRGSSSRRSRRPAEPSRDEVAAEAAAALAGKQSHLGTPPDLGARRTAHGVRGAGPDTAPSDALVGTFTVTIPHGLHARPAARLVQEVRTLDATVLLRNLTTESGPVPASSLSKVATLGALDGHEVEVRVSGGQAREALDHVLALARRGFDEGPAAASSSGAKRRDRARVDRTHPPEGEGAAAVGLAGLPASPGIGVGPVHRLSSSAIEVPDARTDDPAADWRRLREALAAVRREIQRVRVRTAREVGEADAAIFDAHLLLLDDTVLLGDVRARVEAGQGAAPAWAAAVTQAEAELAGVPDPYIRARAADVRAVGDQVLRTLLSASAAVVAGRGVVVAGDLTPAEAADLDGSRVDAVVLAFGSPTAHSAILARAKGIPAVVGAGPAVLELAEGTTLAVDGATGELVADPGPDVLQRFHDRAASVARRRAAALEQAAVPATTRDGVGVLVAANLGSLDDAHAAAVSGADGAGLVRTEFLFLGRARPPGVEEQEKAYLDLAEALGGKRITLRTLDVGGDKPLDYVPVPQEANPFLGLRGLRLSLARPGLLADQLLAVVRVAHVTPVSLMFPMVSTLDELVAARAMVDAAIAAEGRGVPPGLEVGIMVEVPAVALKAAAFAPHVDFFSVGTNDLTQYALAAERGNEAVAAVGDPFDPGVLALVGALCRGAGDRLVAVCGELAADERAAGLLLGLGVRELSVAPPAVPDVKQAVRAVDVRSAQEVAARALAASGPDDVRALAAGRPASNAVGW